MKALLLIALLALPGCTWMDTLSSKGAEASDAALDAALWQICYASPVGAVRREFDTQEEIETYQELCSQGDDFKP